MKLNRWPALSGFCNGLHRRNHGSELVTAYPAFTLPGGIPDAAHIIHDSPTYVCKGVPLAMKSAAWCTLQSMRDN